MSEDDRAAKAARAKAMLKKRQREKAAIGATSPSAIDSETPSRTASPAPKEHVQKESRDLSDVFGKDDGADTSWLSSLPPANTTSPPPSLQTSPPPVVAPHEPTTPKAKLDSAQSKLQQEFDALKRRNESLEAEAKQASSLWSEVDSLRKRNSSLEADSKHLGELKNELDKLRTRNSSLESDSKRLQSLQGELRELKSRNASLQDEVKRLESGYQDAASKHKAQEVNNMELEEKLSQLQRDTDTALENERQTISLLVSEKSSLAEELQRLDQIEARSRSLESELDYARATSKALQKHLEAVQADKTKFEQLSREEQAKSKELSDALRDKDHELHSTKSSLEHANSDAERHEKRVRELEERIQNDDTVEKLESSLKNTQDRADELEFQLSKLKQVHLTLKAERDELGGKRTRVMQEKSELEGKLLELQKLHDGLNQQLGTAEVARNVLSEEKATSIAESESLRSCITELQQKLVEAAATISQNARQLQAANNELKAANRRVEEAESTQKELQAEGTSLMKSLDEMRPKIVELTEVKLELTETISKLQRDLSNNERDIVDLEAALAEANQQHENLELKTRDLISQHEKEHALSTADSTVLQRAHAELQEQLDSANARLQSLDSERSGSQKDIARHLDDLQRTTSLLNQRSKELATLQQEIEALRVEQEENHEHLNEAQDEIEALRTELDAKLDEIERLKEESALPTKTGHPQSLDDELLSSLRQQHALELSSAQSQIRALENQVFEANARSHALQKQLGVVEDQLMQYKTRPTSRLGQRSYSPANRLSSQRPNGTTPLARSILDQNMSAETKHKRLVSLSMLKARIDSEAEAAGSRSSSRASMRGLSPVYDDSRPGTPDNHIHTRHCRSQFLDDSHVFWCHSCTGDLVVL